MADAFRGYALIDQDSDLIRSVRAKLAQSLPMPSGNVDLRDVAYSCPFGVDAKRYDLQRQEGRDLVGKAQSLMVGNGGYLLALLCGKESIEAVVEKSGDQIACFKNGSPVGTLNGSGKRYKGTFKSERWTLTQGNAPFGVIEVPPTVRWHGFQIIRPAGRCPLTVQLARGPSQIRIFRPREWVRFLRENDDLIAPDGRTAGLNGDELALYSAVNLVFRMLVYELDFPFL